ncbi:uncharacterized protein B0H64DRAFT_450959 [Chaetomium fimeti]|uniref:C2H2-type domain-containing protein n=1 Tax=Chaetomium fimeti TaxID=1854472 RepID=A0AAE0H986_9PEZI|nr:hypothetical protein B0H64DRAFT_450959 [Chaetomium fimeti]
MSRPDRPTSNEHVLHRQPRLSPLSRRRELAEKAFGVWAARVREHGTRREMRAGVLLDAQKCPVPLLGPKGTGRILKNIDQRGVVPEVSDDAVARHSTAPRSTPFRSEFWGQSRSSTYGRQSSEWETETLLDQTSGLDDMATYPCPFRKRNPTRFNIRDHEACARAPFDSIRGLKHHIVTYHRKESTLARHQCRRCKQQFETEIALEDHLLLPRDQICEVTEASPVDYEDGITEEMARNLLYGRNATEETWTWGGVWTLLFPDDPEVPDSDFNPVAELVEVEQAFDEGQDVLKESLREKLQLLLPEALDADYLSFLTGQLELVFETHKVNVMKQSLGRCCSTVSGAQPSKTQGAEHPSASRKPNRQSRRSTLLQNMHRSSIQGPTPAPASRRTSHISSSTANKRAHRPFSEQSFLCRTDPQQHRPRSTASTTAAASPPLEQHILYNTHGGARTTLSTNPDPNPRDSRDSGISMPCDACAAEPGGGGEGGGFSPESFKQRVLRGRGVGV